MFKQFRILLGPGRIQALVILLAATGLGSLILNAAVEDGADWIPAVQNTLVAIFVIGTIIIIGGALDPFERGRWASILFPALLALLIGIFFAPNFLLLFAGAAVGWVVAGIFIFRPRGPMAYQQAVKHMRRSEYADAVKAMDELIKDEPDQPNHYRFRAEILRLWGKLDRAKRDYQKMIQVTPENAVAYNGLAEVLLQIGDYDAAHDAAERAYELSPEQWVAAYNLGMIEDRQGDAQDAIEHLDLALKAKVPDARHRLLIHFYRARAYARLGDLDAAREAVEEVKKQNNGLKEWQVILDSDQAETLRRVIEDDIKTARALIEGDLTAADLTRSK